MPVSRAGLPVANLVANPNRIAVVNMADTVVGAGPSAATLPLRLTITAQDAAGCDLLLPSIGEVRFDGTAIVDGQTEHRFAVVVHEDQVVGVDADLTGSWTVQFVFGFRDEEYTQLTTALSTPAWRPFLKLGDPLIGADAPPQTAADADARWSAWLDGSNRSWASCIDVDQATPLITLQHERSAHLYGEVVSSEGTAYRVNVAYLLSLLRSARAEGDLAYQKFGTTARVGSGAASASDAEFFWISGGSATPPARVLQPTGFVPPLLFSFITSDEVAVHDGNVLAPGIVLVTRQDPAVESSALGLKFKPNTPSPLRWSEIDKYATFDPAADPDPNLATLRAHSWAQYESLRKQVQYVSGDAEAVGGLAGAATVTLQARPALRPNPPQWTKTHGLVAKRVFPLRYHFEHGEAHEFTLTQDRVDCVRQDYVNHLQWKVEDGNYYYQPLAPATNSSPAGSDTMINADHEATRLPAFTSESGRFPVPARDKLRRLEEFELEDDNIRADSLSVYRPITLLLPGLRTRLAEVRDGVERRANTMMMILQDVVGPPQEVLSAGLSAVVTEYIFLQGVADALGTVETWTMDQLIKSLIHPHDAITKFTNAVQSAIVRGEIASQLVQASSSWRPPGQNEMWDGAYASNHQGGRALDLQPHFAPRQLALAALHDFAGSAYGPGPHDKLAECFLERMSKIYVAGQLDERRLRWIVYQLGDTFVAATPGAAVPTAATVAALNAHPDNPDYHLITERDTSTPTRRVAAKMADELHAINYPGWPNPTYLQLYLYALNSATHVHFTFVENESLAGL